MEMEDIFMSGDYEAATDNIYHCAALDACTRFLQAIGGFTDYDAECLFLLCSPRTVIGEEQTWKTTSGVLMGDPGSKIVLTILTLVCFYEAYKGEPTNDFLFSSAGDD